MESRYDLAIVGGGIAGGALATALASAGQSVLVLEKATTYPDRVRGEWIAPWGVVEVKRLGLYDTLMAAGGHHIRIRAGSRPHAPDAAGRVDGGPGSAPGRNLHRRPLGPHLRGIIETTSRQQVQ